MSEESQNSIIKTSEYSYVADDMVAMYGANVRWRDYVAAVIFVAMMPGMLAWANSAQGNSPRGPLIFVVLILVFGIVYPFGRMRYIRRKYRKSKLAGQVTQQHHEFDGEYMSTFVSDGTAHRLILADFVVAVAGVDLLYLYINQKQYIAIPWRVFSDEKDIPRLYEMLKANRVRVSLKHPKSSWQGFTR